MNEPERYDPLRHFITKGAILLLEHGCKKGESFHGMLPQTLWQGSVA